MTKIWFSQNCFNNFSFDSCSLHYLPFRPSSNSIVHTFNFKNCTIWLQTFENGTSNPQWKCLWITVSSESRACRSSFSWKNIADDKICERKLLRRLSVHHWICFFDENCSDREDKSEIRDLGSSIVILFSSDLTSCLESADKLSTIIQWFFLLY